MSKLPLFEISGSSSYEIGYNYGTILKDRIQSTVGVYYDWFISIGGNNTMLQKLCNEYETLMSNQCASICQEIEGISKGSGEILWKIYLLNCRTEIFNYLMQLKQNADDIPSECSAIMDTSNCITAQNWDFIEEMHDNAVLLRICKPNHTMLMLIEPGMVGKIGLNSSGIGCTLTLLAEPQYLIQNNINQNKSKGIPIHVLLRLCLECTTLSQIDTLLRNITINTFSCIGVADAMHNGFFLEFCGYNKVEKLYSSTKRLSFHTNHYLGCGLKYIGRDEASMCSQTRYDQLNSKRNSTQVIEQLLTDRKNKDFPICRDFVWDTAKGRNVGTIATIIMDLKKKSMKVSKGTPLKYPFEEVLVNASIATRSRL
eukprot:675434_1